jgi:hypothetical protein
VEIRFLKTACKTGSLSLGFCIGAIKSYVHLLVIDEAHKLGANQRQIFREGVLMSRARRALFLSATPFAMRVKDLYERITDIHSITNFPLKRISALWDQLDEFRECVRTSKDVPLDLKRPLEKTLRSYLVRSLWPECIEGTKVRRRIYPEKIAAAVELQNLDDALAQLGLETALIRLFDGGGRTQIATHRETLCSSYSAIRKQSKSKTPQWNEIKESLITLLPSEPKESPKFDAVLWFLLDGLRQSTKRLPRRNKIIVFCKREETINVLASPDYSAQACGCGLRC